MAGKLFIVATPIGNMSDFSMRAIETLKSVDLIAAEDTRHSSRLMQQYQIDTPLFALHDHNERQKASVLIDKVKAGQNIALISDAGTPLISDPGYVLVKQFREYGLDVVPIPGACALVAALSVSGLPTDNFQFQGFLPAKGSAKSKILESVAHSEITQVFYEAPRRIVDTIEQLEALLQQDRQIVIAKELTKSFETIFAGTASELLAWFEEDEQRTKGEFVLLVSPKTKSDSETPESALSLLSTLSEVLPLKQAAAIVAEHYGLKKNALYKIGLSHKTE